MCICMHDEGYDEEVIITRGHDLLVSFLCIPREASRLASNMGVDMESSSWILNGNFVNTINIE